MIRKSRPSKRLLLAIPAIAAGAIGIVVFQGDRPASEAPELTKQGVQSAGDHESQYHRHIMSTDGAEREFLVQSPISENIEHRFEDDDAYESLRMYSSNLWSGSVDEQLAAIKILSEVGTKEQKAAIERYAKDGTASIAVQLSAIESIDWDKNAEFIGASIQRDDGIAEAIILMASTRDLNIETRSRLDDEIYLAFLQTQRPSTQLTQSEAL